MTIVFYHAPMSTSSITEGVLNQLKIPFDTVNVNISAGDTRNADFLKLNPNGTVPVIVHDGVPIWESAAITMYLGEVFGVEAKLYPLPGPRRGEAMKWIVWGNVNLAAACMRLFTALKPADDTSAATQAAAEAKGRADITKLLSILQGGLADKSFMLGDYSLVDTHLQGLMGWLKHMSVDLASFPGLAAWAQRCEQFSAVA